MASLLWKKDILVCTSESSFVAITSNRESVGPAYKETRYKPGENSAISTAKKTEPSSTDETLVKQAGIPTQEHSGQESDLSHCPAGRILACRFSPSGRYLALCDDYKSLSLYDTEGWHLLSTRMTQKRSMAIAFSYSEDSVYVADKFGDVYSFSVTQPSADGLLILGHLSMLLDVAVSPDDRYILTSDRDEKVRVSCLPNAYNIHSFCLGHTEFISRMAILPGLESVLVTGGGDATLRFWDYRLGKQLACLHLQPEEGGDDEDRGQRPIVTGITCCQKHSLLAITVLGSAHIFLYHVTSTEPGSVQATKVCAVDVQAACWSASFDPLDRLWVLRQLESKPVEVFSITASTDGFSVQPVQSSAEANTDVGSILTQLNSDWSFFESAVSTPSPYANLYKKSFDNTKSYLERKERRIQEQQQKKISKKTDCSLPLGKKAKLETETEAVEDVS